MESGIEWIFDNQLIYEYGKEIVAKGLLPEVIKIDAAITSGAIHVTTKQEVAVFNLIKQGTRNKIISILCKKEDFIAYGNYDDAAYTKVTVLNQ